MQTGPLQTLKQNRYRTNFEEEFIYLSQQRRDITEFPLKPAEIGASALAENVMIVAVEASNGNARPIGSAIERFRSLAEAVES